MATVPESKFGKIEFYETHITPWTNNAVAIGLGLPDVANLAIATTDARTAYDAHLAAQAAAKAATQEFYDKVAIMHSAPNYGSDMIDTIKNFAQSTDDPNVYVLAQIPAPSPPGAVPAPGTPFDFRVELLGNGAVTLNWKSNNPTGASGTFYEIKRSDDGGPLTFVGNAGERAFTDNTIPASTGSAVYELTAVRSTLRGDPAQFIVRLGVNVPASGGEATGEGGLSIAA